MVGVKKIVNYIEVGSGHNVIFLHGWGASAEAFLFVAKSIKCHSVLVDLYGFGKTPHPDYPLTVKDYADSIIELMDGLHIDSAILVGHSFGGRVALEVSAFHPDRVDKLVLIDSAGIRPRRGIKYYCKIVIHKILKKFGRGLSGSEDYKKLSSTMQQSFINIVNYDQRYLLNNVRADTAIFWGDSDTDTPIYMAKILNKKIKSSSLFVLTNSGHFSYVDNSFQFLAILKAFIND